MDWIPTSERLPTKGMSILIYVPKERDYKGPLYACDVAYWDGGNSDKFCCWRGWGKCLTFSEVSHWMPLPELP